MTEVRFEAGEAPALVLTGTGARPRAVELIGARARTVARITGRGKTWRAKVPLQAARWGGPILPLPSGDYELRVDGGELPAASVPITMLGTLRASLDDGRVSVGAPLDPAYDSWEGQAALERRYATRPNAQLENAVFFESFYGRNVSDNPRAIDAELVRRAPGVTRYWSVVDLSVAVPDGSVAVVEGSPEWWRARGAARLLVVNDWLRRRFERRGGQRVLQTWHGTPLKRLALHRGFDPRRIIAVLRESRRWDVLLAQNPYSARILRAAYAFTRRPVWVEGYPRNDVLVTGDGGATRRTLGIADDERVLLYAPTWRDDREEIVDFLDAEKLARDSGAVVLVRGHSRTLLPGKDTAGSRVIDVTAFADTAHLMAASDALITDYSSIMFDFSVTRRPMFFFTPDIAHYQGRLRDFYFDLADRAPGPLVSTQKELTRAIARHDPTAWAERYEQWRAVFNARDDGHAAERVVARILDQGFVTR
ncbi:glycosyl/glycerophosphate transferase [Microbacterium protaetiae]|uniref:Glycosyl/glycerophosphate transferase n=1 Tax=Microbacterium protaetiae TaxID=2509458 RepID=A0A4P6ELE9_9MICO|nr:CDP-glycerol glycerophosphotransferase family protein [Microbacterium protaetiae]QAY61047.1 glycosyl/glycerophosphate transferase [Microbacterium protaetiae]